MWQQKKTRYSSQRRQLQQTSSTQSHSTRSKTNLPFTSLWNANSSAPSYNALQDIHTSAYFGSNPTKTRIKKLGKALKGAYGKDYQEIVQGITTHGQNIKRIIKKYQNIQNVKVLPYCKDLRMQSQQKLAQFKKDLAESQIRKQRQHKEYLNEYWVNKRPDDPEIRIVHTLEPLESMKIYKKGGLQLYMVGGPGIKTKNRNNNSKNKNIRF